MKGMPTTIIVRDGFSGVVNNAFSSYGFPAEAPVLHIFPTEMFNAGSDLTPLEEHFQDVVDGLTKWELSSGAGASDEIKMIEVAIKSEGELFTVANNQFMKNGWRDSLPICPPTEELVDWILTGTEEDPETLVAAVPPRGGLLTVRLAATCLAMAGGRPEYLPFVLAAARLMTATSAGMESWNSTTNSVIPAFVLNGPVAHQLRVGSGYGCLGPDPLHPAGQIMGRAIRIICQNVGGADPGNGTMALFGGLRATNCFFAEDDEGVPSGWTTLAEDRGFSRNQNVLTFTLVIGMENVYWKFGDEKTNTAAMTVLSKVVGAPDENRYVHVDTYAEGNPNLATGMILMPRGFAQSLQEMNGWSKADMKQFIWENSRVPYADMVKWLFTRRLKNLPQYKDRVPADDELVPVCPEPSQLTVVVAGGDQSGHGYFMEPITQGEMGSIEVKLPKNWDDLMLDADIDMGPVATTR